MSDDGDDKIQPLYVEQADIRGQLKIQSLRMDMVLQEITELKSDNKQQLGGLRADVKEDITDIKNHLNKAVDNNSHNVARLEKWIVSMVGLIFTAMVGIASVVIGRMI